MGRTVLAAILAAGLVPLLLIVAIVTQDAHGQGTDTASANPVIIPGFVIPNGLHLSFDHVLSIYEWSGKFLDKRSAVPGVAGSADDTVELDAGSRFLEDNRITTTSTSAFFYADDPLWRGPVAPFVSFLGNSYVTSGLPGTQAAYLITREINGFGAAGLRYRPEATDLDFSASAGLAQESQSEINTEGVVARGSILAPQENLGSNTIAFCESFRRRAVF